MAKNVVLLQTDPTDSQNLEQYFRKHGDRVKSYADLAASRAVLEGEKFDLALVDIHLPGNDWLDALGLLQQANPGVGIILTNRHPDVRRELLARERGVRVFLRAPFAQNWIENALLKLEHTIPLKARPRGREGDLPDVRVPMRAKITLPYAVLALLFALASAYLVSRYVLESMRDRFTTQLIDTGKLSADWMVQEENRMLDTVRLAANLQGLAEAIDGGDPVALQNMLLPVAVNYREDAIEILDTRGMSLLSLYTTDSGGTAGYSITRGGMELSQQDFALRTLQPVEDEQGDKYSGLAQTSRGAFFYIAGPLYGTDGVLRGAVVVGKSLETLVTEIRQDTLAQVSLYGLDGSLLATTFLETQQDISFDAGDVADLLANQDRQSPVRELKVGSSQYSEILGPWEVRGGQDLGLVGTALAQNFTSRPSLLTRLQVVIIVLMSVMGVIILGVFLANQITRPLSKVVQASVEVAQGNLQVKVPSKGDDEVMVLAHAFNYMVSGLQEGFIYRDLLGRTVSPEVREAMRHSFASGELKLEGQTATATVLMSDIRGFTTLSEKEEPTKILNWLNEYFGEIVPIITAHGGVVDKFEGDAVLSFFGILPQILPPEESARAACHAALEIMAVIEKINQRRIARNEPPLITGIGINTGSLTAGGLGASDRLNYTIIGDTVNTTQRIEAVSREFDGSGIVISESTLTALKETRSEFGFSPLGERSFKGKREQLWLYQLLPPPVAAGGQK